MYDDLFAPDGPITTSLDYLFRTVDPDDRGPYSPCEVADLIKRALVSGPLWATVQAPGRPAEAGR
jgi:hypothetical protein